MMSAREISSGLLFRRSTIPKVCYSEGLNLKPNLTNHNPTNPNPKPNRSYRKPNAANLNRNSSPNLQIIVDLQNTGPVPGT